MLQSCCKGFCKVPYKGAGLEVRETGSVPLLSMVSAYLRRFSVNPTQVIRKIHSCRCCHHCLLLLFLLQVVFLLLLFQMNHCGIKSLCFGVISYTAIDNWYIFPQWKPYLSFILPKSQLLFRDYYFLYKASFEYSRSRSFYSCAKLSNTWFLKNSNFMPCFLFLNFFTYVNNILLHDLSWK